jgi:bacteriorhodopsin
VLFVELSRSLDRQPAQVRRLTKLLPVMLVVLWCVYPIAYVFPLIGGDFFGGADGFVLRQAGYSIADILAKAAFGLLIFQVARIKSRIDDPATYDDELAGPAVGRLNGSGTGVQRPIAA